MNNLLFVFVIILIVIIFIYYSKRKVEHFGVDFNINWQNSYQDNRFQKYSQNSNKTWKEQPVSYNSPIVTSYGTSFKDMYKMNQYIFNDFEKEDLTKFVDENSQKLDFAYADYNIDYTPFDIYNFNKATWFNRFEWNPDYTLYQKYLPSNFSEINAMNKIFLYLFNKFFFDFTMQYVKRKQIFYKPYFVMKHRIVNIYSSKEKEGNFPKYRIFEIVTIVARDDAYMAFEFHLLAKFILMKENEYKFEKLNFSYVSNYTYDEVLLRPSLNKDNTYFNLNPLWKNNNEISSAEAQKIYDKGKEEVLETRDFLDYQYACFSYDKNSDDPVSLPVFATDKNDCENKYNIIGYEKPAGVWDRPCQKDSDCIFYQKNKNYNNEFGRCNNGTCEMPLNMRNLGYHYYINEKNLKPLCYNCKSKKWLPNTKMDFCCDEQEDRKKYPFLKGPDYAFKGDSVARFNEYMQMNCRMKPNYNNIFKDTDVWKVDCKGFLDSYLLKN